MPIYTPAKLAELRERRGLTQGQLAAAAGLSTTAISQAELGKSKWTRSNARKIFEALYLAAPIPEPEVFQVLDYLNLDRALLETVRRPKPKAPPVNEFIESVFPLLNEMNHLVGPQVTLGLIRTVHAAVVAAAHQPGQADPTFRHKSERRWNPAIGAYEHFETEYTRAPAPGRATKIDKSESA